MKRALQILLLSGLLLPASAASAASGRVIKVLHEFLYKEGRTALSPSLYERDADQAQLRMHPERRSGLRFYVQWTSKGALWRPLVLKLELRGRSTGNLPQQLVLEEPLSNLHTHLTRWSGITLTHEQFEQLGAVNAWRVSLWEGDKLLGTQQSFLW